MKAVMEARCNDWPLNLLEIIQQIIETRTPASDQTDQFRPNGGIEGQEYVGDGWIGMKNGSQWDGNQDQISQAMLPRASGLSKQEVIAEFWEVSERSDQSRVYWRDENKWM